MKNLVLSILPNPFIEKKMIEYEYSSVSSTSIAAVSPFLDKRFFNNIVVVAVPDTYSVWPEVGAFPRSKTYREVLGFLLNYLSRKCYFLHQLYCRDAYYVPIPWRGYVGKWQFSSALGDIILFFSKGVFDSIENIYSLREHKDALLERIVIVYEDKISSVLNTLLYHFGLIVSSITKTQLEIVYSEPLQYPVDWRKPPRLKLEILDEYSYKTSIKTILSLAPEKIEKIFSEKVFVADKKLQDPLLLRTIKYTQISAIFAKQGMITPLIYNTCSSATTPISKGREVLHTLYTVYIENTLLRKKEVGGKIVHGISINYPQLLLFLAGIGVENIVLRKMREIDMKCNNIYNEGIPLKLLESIRNELNISYNIENKYIEIKNDKVLLTPGSLKKLRKHLLNQN